MTLLFKNSLGLRRLCFIYIYKVTYLTVACSARILDLCINYLILNIAVVPHMHEGKKLVSFLETILKTPKQNKCRTLQYSGCRVCKVGTKYLDILYKNFNLRGF